MNKIITLSIIGLLAFGVSKAQNKEIKTISFQVSGVCGMCEERITNALDVKGVKEASWDKETQMCQVTYRADKISEEQMHELLNEAGHDTEKSTCSDEQYNSVHMCCKYRDDTAH